MTQPKDFPLLEVGDRESWRRWLDRNHDRARGVWLVYYKPHTRRPTVAYGESVEEALCFGWVDNLIRKLDDNRYARRFMPRKPNSNWSAPNRRRVAQLIRSGRMTEHGLALVNAARRSGRWQDHQPPEVSQEMPRELAEALQADSRARAFFEAITPSQRARFVTWINLAKRADTRARRVNESVRLLGAGQHLGMR